MKYTVVLEKGESSYNSSFAHAPRHAETTERGLLEIAGEAGRRRLGGGAAFVRGLRRRPCRRRKQPGRGRMAVGGDSVMAAGRDARALPAPAEVSPARGTRAPANPPEKHRGRTAVAAVHPSFDATEVIADHCEPCSP